MATKSFRIFATKEDLFSIFFDFQQNVKIHYFKCGRMYDFLDSGMTPEQVAKRMNVPMKFINACMR